MEYLMLDTDTELYNIMGTDFYLTISTSRRLNRLRRFYPE